MSTICIIEYEVSFMFRAKLFYDDNENACNEKWT